jgi:hypothetical protein
MNRLLRSVFIFTVVATNAVQAQVLTEWVETRNPSDTNIIALGYPVPIPVDTPLPFDGFRTYAGLHMRHQDLAASTEYVHPEQIGTTFSGRAIWAYRLGDADRLTIDGLPEPATLTNGGIHAREWQTPEVVTGILELLALHENDHHFYDYLRDNVNMVVIPSLNIDGFMQTQRTPSLNYLQADIDFPDDSPRDGRMRRKNMREADEDLFTTMDLLNGVDLNRNNAPFWDTNPDRSSDDPRSIVHHGSAPQSEGETQALDTAAELGPVDRLRIYTDVHSFSQVHFWTTNDNDRLARQAEDVLKVFTDHHIAFPAAKWYAYADRFSVAKNQGIGTTDEYFTNIYQVPSWTLEVEPSNGQSYHSPLPGSGADYGGVVENGHDGFILPESEIKRVREELAQSFAAVYYRQAGPPNIQSLRLVDTETGGVVYEADWDLVDNQSRELHVQQLQPLQISHSYDFWLSFNKPMRWRVDGEVVTFPGQPESGLDLDASVLVDSRPMTTTLEAADWLNQPGGAPDGYVNYQDDALKITFRFPSDAQNRELSAGGAEAILRLRTADITGMRTDANPGTIADWQDGHWTGYEDSGGNDSDFGGFDTSLSFQITDQAVESPFLIEAGVTSSWFDPSHDGEGYLIEILKNNKAVMYWYTYDDKGAQDWFFAPGEVHGNRIEFATLFRASGGEFGPGFDPGKVTLEEVGSASFIWSDCDSGSMSYRVGMQQGRMELTRIVTLLGLGCTYPAAQDDPLPPVPEQALLSGSWYDPTHNGEGLNLEMLADGRALVYWFSYDKQGNRRWFFGIGEYREGKLVFDDMQTSSGGIFGPDFDPDSVEFKSWGTLEMELTCNEGTVSYSSSEDGFGSGELNVVRLTSIEGLNCP